MRLTAGLWTRDENGAVQEAASVLRLHFDSGIGGERVLVTVVAGLRLQLVCRIEPDPVLEPVPFACLI